MMMVRVAFTVLFFLDAVFALVCTSAHQVQTTIGCFQGATNASTGIESFLGVPYAQPPVGQLRFKAPVAITKPLSGVQSATKFGDACNQVIPAAFATTPGSIFATNNANSSEDCLFFNLYRPSGTSQLSHLPVVVFIPGGGNRFGAGSSYDPTLFIRRSLTRKKPLIFITFNYRVTTFGFLANSHMPQTDLNAGFLDQRLLLRFVQQNVAHFGGDPTKVTIMGQSYGAGAAELHMMFPDPLNHNDRLPFRAGILNSASGPFKNFANVSEFENDIGDWTLFLKITGCVNDATAMDCLRALPQEAIMNATNILATQVAGDVWPTVIAPHAAFTIRPSLKMAAGDFPHVPIISGTMTADGTLFVQKNRGLNATSVSQADSIFKNFIRNIQMDNKTWTDDVLNKFNELYPQDLGDTIPANLPFKTGDALYDRSAQWWTEMVFLAHRRAFGGNNSLHAPTWSYYFTQELPIAPEFDGAFHGTELAFMFGIFESPEFTAFVNQYMDFLINFVHDLNPGAGWPQFTPTNRRLIQFANNNITLIPDDFRLEQTDFHNTAKVQAEMEK